MTLDSDLQVIFNTKMFHMQHISLSKNITSISVIQQKVMIVSLDYIFSCSDRVKRATLVTDRNPDSFQVSWGSNLPWKMILVLSSGATAVLATAPANAPEKSELITECVFFRPCRGGGRNCINGRR